jgi:hypothetical protein
MCACVNLTFSFSFLRPSLFSFRWPLVSRTAFLISIFIFHIHLGVIMNASFHFPRRLLFFLQKRKICSCCKWVGKGGGESSFLAAESWAEQGRRKQCEAAGAVISKGHLLPNHHFSVRQYLLKIYCMDTRLLVAIMGRQTCMDINFEQFYSLHHAKGAK